MIVNDQGHDVYSRPNTKELCKPIKELKLSSQELDYLHKTKIYTVKMS